MPLVFDTAAPHQNQHQFVKHTSDMPCKAKPLKAAKKKSKEKSARKKVESRHRSQPALDRQTPALPPPIESDQSISLFCSEFIQLKEDDALHWPQQSAGQGLLPGVSAHAGNCQLQPALSVGLTRITMTDDGAGAHHRSAK